LITKKTMTSPLSCIEPRDIALVGDDDKHFLLEGHSEFIARASAREL